MQLNEISPHRIRGRFHEALDCLQPILAQCLTEKLGPFDENKWKKHIYWHLNDYQKRDLGDSGRRELEEIDLLGLLDVLIGNLDEKNEKQKDLKYQAREMIRVRKRDSHTAKKIRNDLNLLKRDIITEERFTKTISDGLDKRLEGSIELLEVLDQLLKDCLIPRSQQPKQVLKDAVMIDDQLVSSLTRVFTGREKLLSSLVEHVTDYQHSDVFLFGPPGIGKSSIAAKLFELLNEQEESRIIIAAHFVRARDEVSRDESVIVRSIVAQICLGLGWSCPSIHGETIALRSWFEKKLDELKKIEKRSLILILDGFDELSSETQQNIHDLIACWRQHGIKPVLFSRRIETLKDVKPHIELAYNDKGNLEDLLENTEKRLNSMHLPDQEKKRMTGLVVEKANGQFIYQSILIGAIQQGKYTADELSELPPDMMKYYDLTLKKLESEFNSREEFIEHGVPVLALMVAWRDSISFKEISDILRGRDKHVRLVLRIIRELLTSSNGDDPQRYEFVHLSVREYVQQLEYIRDEFSGIHQRITEYLIFGPVSEYFLNYALEHAVKSGKPAVLLRLLGSSNYVKEISKHHYHQDIATRKESYTTRLLRNLPTF